MSEARECHRCGGTGRVHYYHIAGGVCFRCGGTGEVTYRSGATNKRAPTAPQICGWGSRWPELKHVPSTVVELPTFGRAIITRQDDGSFFVRELIAPDDELQVPLYAVIITSGGRVQVRRYGTCDGMWVHRKQLAVELQAKLKMKTAT
jgi:hypothetical protein